MAITVVLPRSLAALFPAFGARPAMPRRIELADEPAGLASLDDVIARLEHDWPGVRDRLCEPGPRLRPFINAFVDGRPADLETPVGAGAVVHLLPAVAGGSGSP
jgi:molybdopterin converting factor small subunit